MTLEEAAGVLERMAMDMVGAMAGMQETNSMLDVLRQRVEAINIAQEALRPVTREQVEMVRRGEWELIGADKRGRGGLFRCTRCRGFYPVKNQFCPHCGAPMTDKAVDMVMERLEALKDGKDD